MSLLRRMLSSSESSRADLAFSEWLSYFDFNGLAYPFTTYGRNAEEEPGTDYLGLASGLYKCNGPVFAVCSVRMLLFSEARFQFQQMRGGRPGDLFGTQELTVLESPGGPLSSMTTGDLLSRAIQDVDLGGNWFGYRPGRIVRPDGTVQNPGGNVIVRWRPDWVKIIAGSHTGQAEDAVPIGYVYDPPDGEAIGAFPWQVAHWAPYPDPEAKFRGMSWLTPIVREVMADQASTSFKLKYFENGATPNLVVQTGLKSNVNQDALDRWIARFKNAHEGGRNAFKTLFLTEGSDAKVVGATLEQSAFEAVQTVGETRIAAAAGVPPIIVGFTEGLNNGQYNIYQQARRRLSDATMRPLWRNLAGSLSTIISVPTSARLWYDDRDVAFLRDDEQDRAAIQSTEAGTISTLVTGGFTPESAVAAVQNNDFALLVHSGLYSVQLQAPGSEDPASASSAPQITEGDAGAGSRAIRQGAALLALLPGTKE